MNASRAQHTEGGGADDDAEKRLRCIALCATCQGHRVEKRVYNGSLVLERTCAQCGGEGVVSTLATASNDTQQASAAAKSA